MFVRRLILCVALFFGCSQSAFAAGAAPACGGVDEVLRSVSILRDIQADQSGRNYAENISALKTSLTQISLPTLQPAGYLEAFPEDALALALYVSSLREAVSKFETGDKILAKSITNKPVPSEVSDSLGSMNRYWACNETEAARAGGLTGSNKSAFKKETGSASEDTQNGALPEPTSDAISSGKTAPARTLAKSISNGPKLDIKGHPLLFIAMVLAVIGLIYGGRKYSKRSRLRDHRYLIHQATRFKVGKKLYEMTIMDITQRGLKFKHDGLIQRQRKVGIELNGTWHACRLVWKNANFAGAKFNRALNTKTLEAVILASQERARPENLKFGT